MTFSPTIVPRNAYAIARKEDLDEWKTHLWTLIESQIRKADWDLVDHWPTQPFRLGKEDVIRRTTGMAFDLIVEELFDKTEVKRLEEEARG